MARLSAPAACLLLLLAGCEEPPAHPAIDEEALQRLAEEGLEKAPVRRRTRPPREEPDPIGEDARAAMAAYRAHLEAWRAGDAEVFFGGFADPLACWNQHEDTPLARARQELGPSFEERQSRGVLDMQPIWSGPEEAELVAWEWQGGLRDASARIVARRVRLRREGEGWRITHTAGDARSLCAEPVARVRTPAFVERLEQALERWNRECAGPGRVGEEDCDPQVDLLHPELQCRPALSCPVIAGAPCPNLAPCVERVSETLRPWWSTAAPEAPEAD
ncbi:MAG TPA: hypothetical protein RMH85_33535 [Polyangiaceae bacterium LLY-WYZ-15_(1-7)]|nr:hypothetical protein [Myxococcales bacterium]MAT24952.1 hypothetical protein [Sandaracinus sp.]HJL06733.1 hypothetical protein [Polyangiaceae bacterium LLY-WYZ-15_(1-7)]MBJ72659.1 hypothetical protein [Sandaracinus sp.]HJL13454.1 hypothetical protein [Polyangiaceae bacterium LLY-WYZ-15_(1-7)]